MKEVDFDDLLSIIGEFGRYQKLMLFYFALFPVACSWFYMIILFMILVPDHSCTVPQLQHLNLTQEMLLNVTIPYDESGYSKCRMYDRNYSDWTETTVHACLADPTTCNASTTRCQSGWNYDTSIVTSNYITEFDVVCDKSSLQNLPVIIYAAGLLVSCITFGILSDMYGRKKVFCFAHVFHIAAAFGWTFAPTIGTHLLFRFLTGVFDQIWYTAFTMGMEMVGTNSRVYVGVLIIYSWNIGYMAVPLIGFLIKDWFYLRLFTTLASSLLLTAIFILDESPRWLYAAQRHTDANKITRKMAKINAKPYPENVTVKVKKQQKGRIWDLVRRKWIRKRFFNTAYQYFTMAQLYIGLTLYLSNLDSNVYLNIFLCAVVDFPGNIFASLALQYLPRRQPYIIGVGLAGLFVISIVAVPEEMNTLRLVLALMAKLSGLFAWAILGVMAVEMYPTVIRKIGYNASEVFCTIGMVVAPYALVWADVSRFIPPVLFGSCALLAAIVAIFLPETKGTHLPDSLEYQEAKGSVESKDQPSINFSNGDIIDKPDINGFEKLLAESKCSTV